MSIIDEGHKEYDIIELLDRELLKTLLSYLKVEDLFYLIVSHCPWPKWESGLFVMIICFMYFVAKSVQPVARRVLFLRLFISRNSKGYK